MAPSQVAVVMECVEYQGETAAGPKQYEKGLAVVAGVVLVVGNHFAAAEMGCHGRR